MQRHKASKGAQRVGDIHGVLTGPHEAINLKISRQQSTLLAFHLHLQHAGQIQRLVKQMNEWVNTASEDTEAKEGT